MSDDAKTKFAEKEYDVETMQGSIAFGDGTSMDFEVSKLPEEVIRTLTLHGLMQKLGDSYAGAKGDFATAKSSVQQVWDQLVAGQWRAARASGEAKPRTTELAAAIARVTGKDLLEVQQKVQDADDAKRKAWRGLPAVAAAIAEIRAERARAQAEKAQKAGEGQELVI